MIREKKMKLLNLIKVAYVLVVYPNLELTDFQRIIMKFCMKIVYFIRKNEIKLN